MHGLSKKDTGRFWSKVNKTKDCWLWTGGKNSGGYGIFHIKSKPFFAHRVVKGILVKNDPRCVCHTCDVPACVNPEHLWFGTPKTNAQDALKKGRLILDRLGDQKGIANQCAVLCDEKVLKIRDLYASGYGSYAKISKLYNVQRSCIQKVVEHSRWKHVGVSHQSSQCSL